MTLDEKVKEKLKLSAEEIRDLYGKLNRDGLQDISRTDEVHVSGSDTSESEDSSSDRPSYRRKIEDVLGDSENREVATPRPLTKTQVGEYTPKIEEFLASLEIAKVVTHDEKYQKKIKAREMVNYKAKNRRKKLKQILDITLDTEQEDSTSDLINQVKAIRTTGGNIKGKNGTTIEITSEESNSVLEMLFLRKDLQEINNLAKEEVELKKGSYSYTKAVKAKSIDTIEFSSANLRVKKFIEENTELYDDDDYKSKTDEYTKEKIEEKDQIIELEKTLEEKRKKMEKSKREVELRGPIVDINEVQKQLFKNDK